jgi:hypothetical protein
MISGPDMMFSVNLLFDILVLLAGMAFAASVVGLLLVAGCRLLAWWRAGQEPKGVRVIISIG